MSPEVTREQIAQAAMESLNGWWRQKQPDLGVVLWGDLHESLKDSWRAIADAIRALYAPLVAERDALKAKIQSMGDEHFTRMSEVREEARTQLREAQEALAAMNDATAALLIDDTGLMWDTEAAATWAKEHPNYPESKCIQVLRQQPADVTARVAARDEEIELAWGIIANAGGGDWTTQSAEWQDAAHRWGVRNGYRAALEPPK